MAENKYTATLRCDLLSGQAGLEIGPEALEISAPTGRLTLSYAEVLSIKNPGAWIELETQSAGKISLLKLGLDNDAFYARLTEAYNARVLKAFFVTGEPLLRFSGDYSYRDEGGAAAGKAAMELYPDCVCILPPDTTARRIPLCFLRSAERQGFSQTLLLDTGESYTLSRLGRDTDLFDQRLNEALAALSRRTADFIARAAGPLSPGEALALSRLALPGAAAPMGALRAVSPAFADAAEGRIAKSRAADTYDYFQKICPPEQICVGLLPGDAAQGAEDGPALPGALGDIMLPGGLGDMLGGGLGDMLPGGLGDMLGGIKLPGGPGALAGAEAPEEALWIAAPRLTAEGGTAAVEFAFGGAAATYVYAFRGGWEDFSRRLNHALEAISFRREAVSLPDEALSSPENALYAMAAQRTAALRFLRAALKGRAIHQTPEAWRRSVDRLMEV